jgi:hypothetical protein
MLKEAGLKEMSTSNSGRINALRYSFFDYKIGLLNQENYSAEDRIKLAALLRHSVMTLVT